MARSPRSSHARHPAPLSTTPPLPQPLSPASNSHKRTNSTTTATTLLTRFHAGYFRISLSLCSQALLWKILSDPSAAADYPYPLRPLLRSLPSFAFTFLWSLALLSLLVLSSLYSLRCLLHFPSVRAEFSHHVGVNYLFAPWISCLLLLQSNPFLTPKATAYALLWWAFSAPILALDVKIYGQWFTKGKRFLSMVANPTSQITVLGNLVGARAAAQMGFKEGATCMFSLGIAHYLVLFVTLYQRFMVGDSLPAMLRPVFFLFFAVPSMASVAWYSINSRFDTACKMFFFLSLFLFASLMEDAGSSKRQLQPRLNLLASLKAGIVQEIYEEVQRSMVGLFVPSDYSGPCSNEICTGSQGKCGELTHARIIRALRHRHACPHSIYGDQN